MYARRGQCLSTSTYILKLKDEEIEIIDDLKVFKSDVPKEELAKEEEKEYCYTDGCGYIREDVCDEINKKFGFSYMSAY